MITIPSYAVQQVISSDLIWKLQSVGITDMRAFVNSEHMPSHVMDGTGLDLPKSDWKQLFNYAIRLAAYFESRCEDAEAKVKLAEGLNEKEELLSLRTDLDQLRNGLREAILNNVPWR